jgi:hypothetical protein
LNVDADRSPVDFDGRHLGDDSTYRDRFRWEKGERTPTSAEKPFATQPTK